MNSLDENRGLAVLFVEIGAGGCVQAHLKYTIVFLFSGVIVPPDGS